MRDSEETTQIEYKEVFLNQQINWSDPDYASYADMNTNDISQAVAPTLNETLLACYWQSEEIECSQYFEIINAELDTCFSFNSCKFLEKYGPAKVRRRGMLHGLRVRLSIRQEEYTFFDKDVMAAGAYVSIECGTMLLLLLRIVYSL